MCKVSVVIPVYNVSKYLKQCLDSILNQTLKDIEVICVDDGSTDDSLDILNRYAQKDKRIRILTQKNQYAGVARNNGMKRAKGDYLAFVDSDDFFEADGIEKLYSLCIKYDLDFVKCSSFVFDNNNQQDHKENYFDNGNFPEEKKNCIVNFNDIPELIKVGDIPWNGLYKKEFLQDNHIQFPALFCVNDHAFFIHCLICAKRVMVSDVYFTHYRVNRKESLIDKKAFHFDCQVASYELVKEAARNLPDAQRQIVLRTELYSLFNWFQKLASTCTNVIANRRLLENFCKKFEEQDVGKDYLQNFEFGNVYAYFRHKKTAVYCRENFIPKISVVIPVYNTAKYLCECLESIFCQTFQEFEVIVIDDGSTDGSSKILKEYAKCDSRLHIFEGGHQGAGNARKIGAEKAKGQYIQFLDSDDWMDTNALQILWNIVSKLNVDICSYCYANVDARTKKFINITSGIDDKHIPNTVFNYRDCSQYIFQVTTPNLITKLFKKSFIEKYLGMAIGLNGTEDIVPAFISALYAKRIIHLNKLLYIHRRDRQGSLETEKDNYPLNFVNGYQRMLANVKMFPAYNLVAQSCANRILRGFVYELLSKKTSDGYNITYEYLGTKGFNEFGLLDQHSYYYNQKDYKILHCMLAYPAIRILKEDLVRLSNGLTQDNEKEILQKYLFIEKLKQRREERPYQIIKDNRKDTHTPKVSVIVPFYNDENYIKECIDHLLQQTLSDIEVICVNDGSADKGLNVLLSIDDDRLVIVSKENQGQAVARNVGVSLAKGKYLYFCDADDYVLKDTLNVLYDAAVQNKLDVVLFDAKAFFESEDLHQKFSNYDTYYKRLHTYDKILSGDNMLKALRNNKEYLPAPVLSFTNRDFYVKRNINFVPGIIHEDNIYTFQLLMKAKRVMHISKEFYYRRVRNDSTMTKVKTFANVYGYFSCLINGIQFINSIEVNDNVEAEVTSILDEWARNGRNIYNGLSQEAKRTVKLLDSQEQILFHLLQLDGEKYKIKVIQDDFYKQELNNVKTGYSFRIGRIITWLPRKIRGGIWCLRDHGIVYTMKRMIEHAGIDMGTPDFKK